MSLFNTHNNYKPRYYAAEKNLINSVARYDFFHIFASAIAQKIAQNLFINLTHK